MIFNEGGNQTERNKEGPRVHVQDQNAMAECFGPWMVVAKDQRRRKQVTRKVGDLSHELGQQEKPVKASLAGKGSCYSILADGMEESEGQENNNHVIKHDMQKQDRGEIHVVLTVENIHKKPARTKQNVENSTMIGEASAMPNNRERDLPRASQGNVAPSRTVRSAKQKARETGNKVHNDAGPIGQVHPEYHPEPSRCPNKDSTSMDLDMSTKPFLGQQMRVDPPDKDQVTMDFTVEPQALIVSHHRPLIRLK